MSGGSFGFLHIMPKEKFTYGFVEFTFISFPDVDVKFIVYGSDDAQGYMPYDDGRIFSVPSAEAVFKDKESRRLLREADVVILNWVNLSILPGMWQYLSKTHLLFWGGDYSPYVGTGWNGLSHCLKKRILSVCIRRSRGVIGLVPSDLSRIESISRNDRDQRVCEICYLPSRNDAGFVCADARPSSPVNILLGNSATPTNRHKSALDTLSRFAGEDIRIYAPLSYGDDEYRDGVIAYGRKIFGEKFIPITDFMNRAEYVSLLSKMSIGVFNYNRQQGLGNIHILMCMGAKVYISRDGGMLSEYIDNGAFVECFEDIKELSFDEFRAELDSKAVARNKSLYSGESIYNHAKNHWGAFYSYRSNAGGGA